MVGKQEIMGTGARRARELFGNKDITGFSKDLDVEMEGKSLI